MTQTYNVYCDESCHLEGDHQPAMVLGAVWCPLERTPDISRGSQRKLMPSLRTASLLLLHVVDELRPL